MDFNEMREKCPLLLRDGECAATYSTAVKCSEAHCAVLFWIKAMASGKVNHGEEEIKN